jgi:hypothetical protein
MVGAANPETAPSDHFVSKTLPYEALAEVPRGALTTPGHAGGHPARPGELSRFFGREME